MSEELVQNDLTVVGGGMAGTCAAIAAAREGIEVALVNDRPVLGGNASSEIRVWINGATGGSHNRYAREGGIMEELVTTNKYRNPGGSPDVWDSVLIDIVREQPRLDLYLNTLVTDVETEDDRIVAASGPQQSTEKTFRFESPRFVDATGDAVLAAEAGAEYMQGRESAEAFDERAAPPEPDDRTLGSSIMFSSKVVDRRVEFEPPEFARDFRTDPPEIVAQRTDPEQRNECYWWIEYGGEEEIDPIADDEEIRDELWAIVYGIWDYIKNSGAFPDEQVANLQLEWVGKLPGKRESRRVYGDHVLTEDDVVSQRRFPDAVGHGGWSIDLHPPGGIYDDQGRGSEHYHVDGPYAFPYRILYARDLDNVFLAGRHVSASHVAFGSLRVQMTLATAGQAAGTAAALCEKRGLAPAELYESGVDDLQQALLREDQWVIDAHNEDSADLARKATVTASSEQPPELTTPETTVDLDDTDLGLHLSCDGHLDSVQLLLEGVPDSAGGGDRAAANGGAAGIETGSDATDATDAADAVALTVSVHGEDRPENTIPGEEVRTETIQVPADGPTWVEVPVDHDVGEAQGVFLVLQEPEGVRVHARERELTGVMALPKSGEGSGAHGLPDEADTWGVPGQHARAPTDWVPCFRLDPSPETPLFGASNVVDGYARPFGLGHSWISGPFETIDGSSEDGNAGESEHTPESGAGLRGHEPPGAVAAEPEWIELAWDEPREVAAVQLVANTRLNDWFNTYGDELRAEPETVRDYRIEAHDGEEWTTVATEADNYRRFRRHVFDPVETDRLRVVIEATNGVPWAELFEIRAYGPDPGFPLAER